VIFFLVSDVAGDGEGHAGRLMDVFRREAIANLMELGRAETQRVRLVVKGLLTYRIDDRIGFEELSAPFLGIGPDHPVEDIRL